MQPSFFLKVVQSGTHKFFKSTFRDPASFLGVPWDPFGWFLRSFGTTLGPLGSNLGSLWGHLGPTWAHWGSLLRSLSALSLLLDARGDRFHSHKVFYVTFFIIWCACLLSVYLSICLSAHLSICPFVYLSICPSVYLLICHLPRYSGSRFA